MADGQTRERRTDVGKRSGWGKADLRRERRTDAGKKGGSPTHRAPAHSQRSPADRPGRRQQATMQAHGAPERRPQQPCACVSSACRRAFMRARAGASSAPLSPTRCPLPLPLPLPGPCPRWCIRISCM
eukprot:365732-Chlamydomonas_euryale.AAC.1